jgi:hypothetical protein
MGGVGIIDSKDITVRLTLLPKIEVVVTAKKPAAKAKKVLLLLLSAMTNSFY